MNNNIIAQACIALRPNAGVSVEEIGKISWDVDTTDIPTKEEIIEKANELQATYDSLAYSRARKAKYDALNQLELISDDAINDTTTHKDAIVAIKTAHPKPE